MYVREILRSKGEHVVTIGPGAPVLEAMRLLVQHNIGAVVVVLDGAIKGILSERDLLRASAADPTRLLHTHVEELMTTRVFTALPGANLNEVMDTMTEHRIRHLPIADAEGALRGMISIGDVINALRQNTEAENRYLHSYIAGTPL